MKTKSTFSVLSVLLLFSISCLGQTEGFATADDSTPIYFRTFGKGKPLLIINGGPGMNSNGFESIAKKLSEKNLTIIYDQRGTGKSVLKNLNSSTVTMKLMIDDMENLRKYLKIEKWSILGHSFGGMLAAYYATLFPDHIDKLIFSSSGGLDLSLLNDVQSSIQSKLSNEEKQNLRKWSNQIDEGDTTYFARLERGKALAPAYVVDRKWIPVIADRLTQGNSVLNQLIWDDLRKITFDCKKKLTTFDRPVLILQGDQDILKPEIAETAHQILKNSKLVFLKHSEILKPYIRELIIQETTEERIYKVLPDTGLVIGFQYKGKLSYLESQSEIALSGSGITGLRDQFRMFKNSADIGSVLVFFKDAGAANFIHQPLHELFRESISLESFIKRTELQQVEEKLFASTSDAEKIRIVEQFLISRLIPNQPDLLVLSAISLIKKRKGNLRISDLITELNISQSPLEKRFRQIVGTSPKKFASIVRFKFVIENFQSVDSLYELGFSAGFYDQAHFIKEFKIFTGQTPEEYFRNP